MEDWTPEPIVTPLTELEQTELEKRPVIIGYVIIAFPALPALFVRRGVSDC